MYKYIYACWQYTVKQKEFWLTDPQMNEVEETDDKSAIIKWSLEQVMGQ